MPFYYCNNAAHAKPLIFHSAIVVAGHVCSTCHQPTLAANGVVRYTKINDYDIVWHEAGATLYLLLRVGARSVLIPDDALPYDHVGFNPNDNLRSPGGGEWFGPLSTFGGGRRIGNRVVSASLNRTTLKLGQNDAGNAFGLAHVVKRHPEMLGTLSASPAWPVDLAHLRDNLRGITAQPGRGVGVRWIAWQTNNQRYVIHGVSPGHQHAMLVISDDYNLITGYGGQNMGGLGQVPVTFRDWT